jgi:hypothetical protein
MMSVSAAQGELSPKTMSYEDDIRRLAERVEQIHSTQERFVSEWRAAREESAGKEAALREQQARLKAETAARQREYRIQLVIVIALCAFVLWRLTRAAPPPPVHSTVSAPAK